MQLGFASTSKRELKRRQRAWEAWCHQRRNMPRVIDFARKWARAMEGAKVGHETLRIGKIADHTLAHQVDRRFLTDLQFRLVVRILCDCWCHQDGLRNWARQNGWLTDN